MTRWGMAIDLRRCVGCQTCTIACKQEHGLPAGTAWRFVADCEVGEYPDVRRLFLPMQCMHCAEPPCVPVCPTHANREFEGTDPRLITTHDDRCIGCGTCVEVCPANHANGGQTLRVIEAPTEDWMAAVEEFEKMEAR